MSFLVYFEIDFFSFVVTEGKASKAHIPLYNFFFPLMPLNSVSSVCFLALALWFPGSASIVVMKSSMSEYVEKTLHKISPHVSILFQMEYNLDCSFWLLVWMVLIHGTVNHTPPTTRNTNANPHNFVRPIIVTYAWLIGYWVRLDWAYYCWKLKTENTVAK